MLRVLRFADQFRQVSFFRRIKLVDILFPAVVLVVGFDELPAERAVGVYAGFEFRDGLDD